MWLFVVWLCDTKGVKDDVDVGVGVLKCKMGRGWCCCWRQVCEDLDARGMLCLLSLRLFEMGFARDEAVVDVVFVRHDARWGNAFAVRAGFAQYELGRG